MRNNIRKYLNEELTQISNFQRLMNSFKSKFPEEFQDEVDKISEFIKSYVDEHGFTIKFLNSCATGFKGVRTNRFIIICSPQFMETLGDFVYTIFHEIRHEEQMSEQMLNLPNPLTGDLSDFEKLYEDYWNLELDADSFAKRKIAELTLKLGLPIEISKKNLKVSPYVENYPSTSQMVKSYIKKLVAEINTMKEKGMDYEDIIDHPVVQRHLDKLEDFF